MSRKNFFRERKVHRTPAHEGRRSEQKYTAQVDGSRYESRVDQLINLHDKAGVRAIFALAESLYRISPIILAQWATNDQALEEYPPEDPILIKMLSDLRGVFEEKKQEVADLTWIDLLDEYATMVPRIEVSYNWSPYDKHVRKEIRESDGAEVFKACTTTQVESDNEPALPVGIPAFVTIRIPISPMKVWGLDKMVGSLRNVLRDALRHCPSPEEAPEMMGTIPRQREFLMNVQNAVLEKDIERYKRYTNENLNFRQIAYIESQERSGKTVDLNNLPERIRYTVSKESAVCESVIRIYEAIYLKPFPRARRRRLDAPAQGMAEYNCPEHHVEDCHRECSYLKGWFGKVDRTLPTDITGSGAEQWFAGGEPTTGEIAEDADK